jgi:hypothetical protein
MKYSFLVSHWTLSQALVVGGAIAFCLAADKLIRKYKDWAKIRDNRH